MFKRAYNTIQKQLKPGKKSNACQEESDIKNHLVTMQWNINCCKTHKWIHLTKWKEPSAKALSAILPCE